jgi:hypothetical protein
MTAAVGNTPGSVVKAGSMGRPCRGSRSCSSTRTGEVEGPGEGEICFDLRHPLSLMTGYQGDEERNAEAMEGGWYHTGDVASIDADGYITYVGRTDDVFKAERLQDQPVRTGVGAHRAPGGRRGGRRARSRRGAPGVPKAYISCSRPDTSRRRHGPSRSSPTRASTCSPGSGCAGSSSPSCPRRSACALGGEEFRDSDFPDLKG